MISVSDALQAKISDDSQAVSTQVDVVFADSRHVDNLVVSVDPVASPPNDLFGSFFTPEQAINGIEEETFSWCVTDTYDINGNYITADGTYYAMDDEPEQGVEYGWWTSEESDGSGVFADPETIEVLFDLRRVNSIRVNTAYSFGRVATGTLSYKDSLNAWHTHSVTIPATDWGYTWTLTETTDVKGLRFEVLTTHNPTDHGRVYELVPLYTESFYDDDIVSWGAEKTRENTDMTSPIGNTAANSFSVVFHNIEKDWSPDGDGLWSDYVQPDIIVRPYLFWEGYETEPIPVGEFYVDTLEASSEMTMTFSCRDFSKYMMELNIEDGLFFEDETVGNAISHAVKVANVPKRKIFAHENLLRTMERTNPVSIWTLDDAPEINESNAYDDTDILDYMGENHGSLTYSSISDVTMGDVSIVSSLRNFAISFNNVSGSYVSIPYDTTFNIAGEYTLVANVKVRDFPSSGTDILVAKKSGANANYSLVVNSSNQIVASSTNAAGTVTATATSAALNEGQSYFVASWYDATDDKIHLRVDDTEVVSTTTITNIYTGSHNILIGGDTASSAFDGWIQCVAVWDRKLSAEEIESLYIESKISEVLPLSYLYMIETTLWDGMLEWATADIGIFYFNEYGEFIYEYRSTLHETALARHAEVQHTFYDDVEIISGQRMGELQVNKVVVNVNPITTINSNVQSIWRAEEGESLVVTKLLSTMTDIQTDEIGVRSTNRPLWKDSGYFKIDDEIIGYDSKSGNKLIGLTRGMFGTTPAAHGVGSFTFADGEDGFRSVANAQISQSSTVAYSGTNSLRIECVTATSDPRSVVSGYPGKAALPLAFGSTTVSMRVYTETNARGVEVGLRFFDGNGNFIENSYGTETTSTMSTWVEYTHTVTPSGTKRYMSPIIRINDIVDGDVFYIDAVTVSNTRAKVREARFYDIEFDSAPAINVQPPFISAVLFDRTAEIDQFTHDAFGATVLVSASNWAGVNDTVLLEGTDPLTELDNFFSIAGIPLIEESTGEEVVEESLEVSSSIRKHQIKELTIDNKFIQDKDYASVIARFLIDHFQNPVPVMEMSAMGVPNLQLGDRIKIGNFDQLSIVNKEFWILSTSLQYSGGIEQSFSLREVS